MHKNQNMKRQKRSKERYIFEASNLVQQWRDLFSNGYTDYAGNLIKPTLNQAANLVGCSKKTLEDYYSVFRRASKIIDISQCLQKKMGYLRQVLKYGIENLNVATPVQGEIEEIEEKNYYNDSWNNLIIEAEDQNNEDSNLNTDRYIVDTQIEYERSPILYDRNQNGYCDQEYCLTEKNSIQNWKEIQIVEENDMAIQNQNENFFDF
ncbi:unnamed protein product [Paramecium sonneborni]|uniref:Uncharacterized protein n=1 Tax=Paramecium sonneborni TaxID=65129 RepID=A0A8S1L023_9CILI|nr:unnamed protein product [Paramecium sonneborni]